MLNIFLTNCVGPYAVNEYTAKPTEWLNFTKSDVLYIANSSAKNKTYKLPPILIEVQYTANMAFFKRLIDYSLSVEKQYHEEPIVIAIVTHNITNNLLELTSQSNILPFFKTFSCLGWAKKCYLMNSGSISNCLDENELDPLVALGHFLIKQKQSLSEMERKDDKTIQLLYKIAKDIFGDVCEEEESANEKIEDICKQTYNVVNMAKQILIEDVKEEALRKRTVDFLDNGLTAIEELCSKHSTNALSRGKRARSADNQTEDPDWRFVESFRLEQGSKMDWKVCFELGQEKNLFKKYSTSKSLKAAFYRYSKK